MNARSPHEPHRAATPLELLYDLCFVVAIAQAAAELHHSISRGHGLQGALSFGVVFFAIWWAWMGFCWFASSFDTDDAPYRLKVLVQMVGVLVLAAGVPNAFEQTGFGRMTLGYAIMRVGLVAQWLRARHAVPEYRVTAGRYALGIVLLQFAWIAALWLPPSSWLFAFGVLVPIELAVPAWAERERPTTWHPHHIAERYGLMTIIVLGETVLAGTLAIQSAFDEGTAVWDLLPVAAAAPLIVFSLWWIYYSRPHHELLHSTRAAFVWGYGHYFVFAAAAAVGAGLAVAVDHAAHRAHLGEFWAGQALAIPVAAYLASFWLLVLRPCTSGNRRGLSFAGAIGLVLLAPMAPGAPLLISLVLASLTAYVVAADAQDSTPREA
ncbi:MAG: low temperature requirement protein A [Planctomycetota bacterium]